MKTLFLAVTEQLSSLDIFKYIDMDKGQLDRTGIRPAVAFPCALVRQSFSFEEHSAGVKNRIGQVRIRLAFDQPVDRTSALVPEGAREASLDYINKAEEVFEAFRSFDTDEYTSFEVNEFLQEDRNDGLVVIRMSFRTNRLDVE